MFDYIDKLRTKHEKTKKRIALVFATSFSLVILFIWFTVSLPEIKNSVAEQAAIAESKTPVTNFVDMLSKSITEVQQNISNAKSAINMLSSTSEYYLRNASSSSVISVMASTTTTDLSTTTQKANQKTTQQMIQPAKQQIKSQ